MSLQQRVTQGFIHRYGAAPAHIVRAPGRVNLIGEHTDYNEGYVLPMAIDREVWISLRPRADQQVMLYSLDFEETTQFDLDHLTHEASDWPEYFKGVAWALKEAGYGLQGFEGVVSGNVPIGAGLASSAALELAAARAFLAISGSSWNAEEMAMVGQRAENDWVEVKCGIMDQLVAASGRAGHALLIDCRSLDIRPVALPSDSAVVVLDTNTRRGLVESRYNERRVQCELAASFFGVPALRDVSGSQIMAKAHGLDRVVYRRARHVVTENERTLQAVKAMQENDPVTFGELMNASHASLRDDFEVSSDELNEIVACARRDPACYGARMTGAGFAGCGVALVRAEGVESFVIRTVEDYSRSTGIEPEIYLCKATDGAGVIET